VLCEVSDFHRFGIGKLNKSVQDVALLTLPTTVTPYKPIAVNPGARWCWPHLIYPL
jgi:hypothetical protein